MSLFPAYFGARKRASDDQAPPAVEPEPEAGSRADIFNLIPPRAAEKYERPAVIEKAEPPEAPPEPPEGRNVHPVNAMDLTRMSIDNDGRLYWDGKPVEVRRRLMMSRGQIIGTSLIAFCIVVAAIGAAIQASVTVHNWACRAGWATQCAPSLPATPAPRTPARVDIPT